MRSDAPKLVPRHLRVRIREGKEPVARLWMSELQDRHAECETTLVRERTKFEAIFASEQDGRLFLDWFSLQEEGGASPVDSDLPIDKTHMSYWSECVDREFIHESRLENCWQGRSSEPWQ